MKKGFTLIEILAVVLIIGVLSAIAVPQYRRSLERSRVVEAMDMLPAIYDAQQRFFTESETTPYLVSFNLLDINLKGSVAGDAHNQWRTHNFLYTMGPVRQLASYFSRSTAPVWAVAQKGKYKGAKILYDGENFSCCDVNADGACEAFALSKNPFYCDRLADLSHIDMGNRASWESAVPATGPKQAKN